MGMIQRSPALNAPLSLPQNIQDSVLDLGLDLDSNPFQAISVLDSFTILKLSQTKSLSILFASRANCVKLMENKISKRFGAEELGHIPDFFPKKPRLFFIPYPKNSSWDLGFTDIPST